MTYREEYSKGVAEDQSRVLLLDEQVQVGAGHFAHVLMTEDFSPIEPKVSEFEVLRGRQRPGGSRRRCLRRGRTARN